VEFRDFHASSPLLMYVSMLLPNPLTKRATTKSINLYWLTNIVAGSFVVTDNQEGKGCLRSTDKGLDGVRQRPQSCSTRALMVFDRRLNHVRLGPWWCSPWAFTTFDQGLDEDAPRALRIFDMDCDMEGSSKGIVVHGYVGGYGRHLSCVDASPKTGACCDSIAQILWRL